MSLRFTNFTFTLNNYTTEELLQLKAHNWKYIVFGQEKGDEGTPHLQGFVQCKRMRESAIQRVCKRLKPQYLYTTSTPSRAAIYCKKGEQPKDEWNTLKEHGPNYGKNAVVYEAGTLQFQGKRNDIEAVVDMIADEATNYDILHAHPKTYFKYYKNVAHVRYVIDKHNYKKFRKVDVIVRVGPSGTGKSRVPFELGGFIVPEYAPKLWMDGYEGEDIIILNEYTGQMKIEDFLAFTDGYPQGQPIKGTYIWPRWTKIYLTSNVHPEEWYDEGLSERIKRRLTKIEVVG